MSEKMTTANSAEQGKVDIDFAEGGADVFLD